MTKDEKRRTDGADRFKESLDKQNRLERARDGAERRKRDEAEGEAAHHGLAALERHSKGRPKQK